MPLTANHIGHTLQAQGGNLEDIGRKILELPPAEAEVLSGVLARAAHDAGHVASEVKQDEEGFHL